MALRAFRSNPSIGGFGGESTGIGGGRRRTAAEAGRLGMGMDDASSSPRACDAGGDAGRFATGEGGGGSSCCDAFAQIVKELVDNAVDACAAQSFEDDPSNDGNEEGAHEGRTTTRRRVRVTMTPVTVSARSNDDDDYSGRSMPERSCLRVVVSDNGCGMADIDYCVSAFGSNKHGTTKRGANDELRNKEDGTEEKIEKSIAKNSKGGDEQKSSRTNRASDGNDDYTSGRYGVGLTLCLLHAQRLVPGTGACVTSATGSASEWTRATYEPDTDADVIVCKKKERFPKIRGESGTTISLLVPGGEDARRAWPRLAEYFARFQLTTYLPCSLEVKAPTLLSRPLYIRPLDEMERRKNRTQRGDDGNSTKDSWDGGDGFDEGIPLDSDEDYRTPKISRAAQQLVDAEVQKKKKISLICKAAAAYKRRPDLKVENVAHSMQPIRRSCNGSRHSTSSRNGPVLEMSLIVFGPDLEGTDNHSDCGENGSYPRGSNGNRQSSKKNSSELQVVRMVNGIPLLDSSEALACGVINKVSSNSDTWSSFGLNVSRKSENDQGLVPLNEINTPTILVKDSAQVAPFLMSTTHSLFQDRSRDWNQSSSDDDEFDTENRRGKRKKARQTQCLLPAALRLGDILMVVQICAKPSALPLPTLSKGRLPLNDKGISDALENGLADCLRCLRRSSPGLLLTARQLKKVERDVKYVPTAAGAITSVLCRSMRSSVYDNAMNITSNWDDEVKRMGLACGIELGAAPRTRRTRSAITVGSINTTQSRASDKKVRVDALRSILERRLRFIVSDEFKDSKKNVEKEQQKRERANKRTKKTKAAESDEMKSDCFDSDSSDHSGLAESKTDKGPRNSPRDHCRSSIKFDDIGRRQNNCGSLVSSSIPLSPSSSRAGAGLQRILSAESYRRQPVPLAINCSWKGENPDQLPCKNYNADVSSPLVKTRLSLKRSPVDNFDDGYESSPKLSGARREGKNSESIMLCSSRLKCDSLLNDGFQSEATRLPAHCQSKSHAHDDDMSSNSEWSSQYGDVVAGHFFR